MSPLHPSVAPPAAEREELVETRRQLLADATRKFGPLPPALLVELALAASPGADFPVHAAALEALRRRWKAAKEDGLVVSKRPARGRPFGDYATTRSEPDEAQAAAAPHRKRRRGGAEARPYVTTLDRLELPLGSCDCPDFLGSSLGVCKHLLVVLASVFEDEAVSARVASDVREDESCEPRLPRLAWAPRLPLTGPLDRLAGLRLDLTPKSLRPRSARAAGALARLEAAFGPEGPRAAVPRELAPRHELLLELTDALGKEGGHHAFLEASSAAKALLSDELLRVERSLHMEKAARKALPHLDMLKRRLHPYQREGAERFLRTGRLLLADDMGLGKTMQAIAVCHALFKAKAIRKALFIVPSALKPQWLREWAASTELPAAVMEGSRAGRVAQLLEGDVPFLITSYELLQRDLAEIQRFAPDLVVLDEAQRIKNYASKSALYVKALAPAYRLVLTGTPMENRMEELASLLDWVDPTALAPKWRLVPWYTAWDGDGTQGGRAGARHLDTLRERLAPVLLRRNRAEVLGQLPERTTTRVAVGMTTEQQDAHDECEPPIRRLLAMSRHRPLLPVEQNRLMALLNRQRQVAGSVGLLDFEATWAAVECTRPSLEVPGPAFSPKLQELRQLIEQLAVDQGRKVLVFSQWVRMLRFAEWSVRDILESAGRRAVFFTGQESPEQRKKNVAELFDAPDVAVMFLSDAGGVGLNLQAASACVNLEVPWNPAVLEQRVGRIHRQGQQRPVDVYNLVAESSIEARIAHVMGTKHHLFKGLFDGTSDALQFESSASFLTSVEQLLDPGPLHDAPDAGTEDLSLLASLDDLDAPSPTDEPLSGDDAPLVQTPMRDESVLPTAGASGPERQDAGASESVSQPERAAASDGAPTAEGATAAQGARDARHADGASAGAGSSPHDARESAGSPVAFLDALRVERLADGRVVIEAPPEAAGSLIALFDGLARLLAATQPR